MIIKHFLKEKVAKNKKRERYDKETINSGGWKEGLSKLKDISNGKFDWLFSLHTVDIKEEKTYKALCLSLLLMYWLKIKIR